MSIGRLRGVTRTLILACFLIPPLAQAENVHNEHGAEHGFHRNVVGVFLGGTGENRRDADFTFGIGYERFINESFGIGGIIERAFGHHDFWILAMPFAYHTGDWKWYIAPGVENKDGHSNEFLVRVGAEYVFDVGGIEVSPQLAVDFVDGHNEYILGVIFAKGF